MTLYEELSNAVPDGLRMLEILQGAAANGLSQSDANDLMQRLYDSFSSEQDSAVEDVIVDVWDVVRDFCTPQHRIWK